MHHLCVLLHSEGATCCRPPLHMAPTPTFPTTTPTPTFPEPTPTPSFSTPTFPAPTPTPTPTPSNPCPCPHTTKLPRVLAGWYTTACGPSLARSPFVCTAILGGM